MRKPFVRGALLLVLAACGTTNASRPSPSPTPAPSAVEQGTPPTAPPTPLPVAPPETSAPVPPRASPTGCPPSLAAQLVDTQGATQLITVQAALYASTAGTVTLWQHAGSCWTVVGGPWSGRLGGAGLSDHHKEGDGTTPTGAYDIGPVMYGIAPNPGVRYSYHQLVCGDWWDWWDEDPRSPTYNTFQHVACDTTPAFGGGSEALWKEIVAYQSFAVIDYNAHPVVRGAGSAVFLHDDVAGPTAGCVSLPPAELRTTLRWLDPSAHPVIVVGTAAEIRRF